MKAVVPFNMPRPLGRELEYVADTAARGQLSGDGQYTREVQRLLSAAHNGAKVLLTPSGTHALELAALLLNLEQGDEVILPSFTFSSVANAFLLRGARLVFCDVRRDTLNIDETQVQRLITPRTRAIVPVHYAGISCEMDALCQIGAAAGVAIVEDNAHGLFGEYQGRPLGTFGSMSASSFHETKNFSCGEGGALVINDATLANRAEIVREKGTNRSQFFRGAVDKYTWMDIGSSYLLGEMLAAFLLGQLEQRALVESRRRQLCERYDRSLAAWAAQNGVSQPTVPDGVGSAHHLYYLVLPSLQSRTALMKHLNEKGIGSVFHYLPLHLSPMGRSLGGQTGDCPVTESISDRLLRLPLFSTMTDAEQDIVLAAVQQFSVAG